MTPLVRVGRLGQVAMETIMNTVINMTYFLVVFRIGQSKIFLVCISHYNKYHTIG